MTKNVFISEAEFDEFCKLVFFQLSPSDSEDFDTEVLTYAIYWQLCYLFGQPLDFGGELESRTNAFRRNIQNILNERMSDAFDILQVIDRNISEQTICKCRQKNVPERKTLYKYFKTGNPCYL